MPVVYRSEMAEVHHGDALDVLATLDTESVDLVITDPPYGVEWRSHRRTERFGSIAHDTAVDRDGIHAILAEAVRVVGQNRHLYVFGPDDVLTGLKVSAAVDLIWDKGRPGMGDLAAVWAPAHERITFVTSKHRHAGEAGRDNLPTRLRRGSVIHATPLTGRHVKRHPTEKPLPLLRELIESSSRAGDSVLDPFAGSGSTGVAAILAGRRATLVEIDDAHISGMVDRVRAAERLVKQAAAA